MKASDLFIEALEKEGVEYIFGIPGEENLDFLNSLKDSHIQLILTRHEQAAGFVLLPGGRRRLPEDNVRRFRNRLRGLRDRWRHGTVTGDDVERRVRSWIAHAEHADTWRLRQSIFRGGWFDPSREPDPPPGACCVAVPGTTTPGTCAPRTATGTPPGTGTTTTGSVWPARSTAGTGGVKAPPGAR